MNWKKIHSIENVIATSYDSFGKALHLGLIIYYNQESELQVLNTISFEKICNNLEKGNSYYEVVDNSILFKFGNVLKSFKVKICSFETICKTDEENISVLNSEYCLGSTSKRKPRISRNEIISTIDNRVVYRWSDDKVLVACEYEKYLFQTKFKGDLYLLDIKEDVRVWEIVLDEGIPGRRYFQQVGDNKLLVQKYFSSDKNNLVKLDLSIGATLWEIENTLSYYNFDESSYKLYGIGDKTFQVVNVESGERELLQELNENLHIVPHLTFYTDSLLYFSGYRDTNIPVFGAVNVGDGKLVFTQVVEMPGEKSFRKGLDRPIVVGNRLYVRDAMKTLHVYEREDHPV